MTAMLILDNRESRLKLLMEFLSGKGFQPVGIVYAEETLNLDLGRFDLVILALFPVSFKTWKFYKTLKKSHPNLPVLFYSKHDQETLSELRQDILLALHYKTPPNQSGLIKGGSYGKTKDIAPG